MNNKRVLKGILGVFGAIVLSAVIYIGAYSFTYNAPLFSTATETGAVAQLLSTVTNQPAVASATATQASTDGITLETLATYNGKNGQPAYVAYNGVVYDVSALAVWRNGSHHGVSAGTDITEQFARSPHVESIFKLAVVVGNLVK